jgi:type II secretory pathway component PulF
MLFSPRISIRELAQLCHRLAISVSAGIDARKIWAKETERANGLARSRFAQISHAINQGETLRDALAGMGEFFPVLFREMVAVGEQTGRLDSIFKQLSLHYQERLTLRRQFWAAISWPMIELIGAVAIIGFLIWISGIIRQSNPDFDPLGCGLYGNQGLAIYLGSIIIIATILRLIFLAIGKGLAWARPIQRIVMKLPVLGNVLDTLALARLAWSLSLTVDAGMDIRRALRLSLASTNNAKYTDHIDAIDAEIENGSSIFEAFMQAGCFPAEFLDTTAVGEQTGKLDESMANLSRQYQEQATYALKTLNKLAAFLVWLIIASLIVTMIFRLFFSYFGALNQALNQ